MVRRVFYSFHYSEDGSRAAQVRNMGLVEGNQPARDNDWEAVKKGGDKAIEKWINDQRHGRSCTAVLIGRNTAGRKWINYEIETSWNDSMGVFGVYIHNLRNLAQQQSHIGSNPFETFTMKRDQKKLSSIVKVYNPPYSDSKQVYAYINNNFAAWVEEAISIRKNY